VEQAVLFPLFFFTSCGPSPLFFPFMYLYRGRKPCGPPPPCFPAKIPSPFPPSFGFVRCPLRQSANNRNVRFPFFFLSRLSLFSLSFSRAECADRPSFCPNPSPLPFIDWANSSFPSFFLLTVQSGPLFLLIWKASPSHVNWRTRNLCSASYPFFLSGGILSTFLPSSPKAK